MGLSNTELKSPLYSKKSISYGEFFKYTLHKIIQSSKEAWWTSQKVFHKVWQSKIFFNINCHEAVNHWYRDTTFHCNSLDVQPVMILCQLVWTLGVFRFMEFLAFQSSHFRNDTRNPSYIWCYIITRLGLYFDATIFWNIVISLREALFKLIYSHVSFLLFEEYN